MGRIGISTLTLARVKKDEALGILHTLYSSLLHFASCFVLRKLVLKKGIDPPVCFIVFCQSSFPLSVLKLQPNNCSALCLCRVCWPRGGKLWAVNNAYGNRLGYKEKNPNTNQTFV